MILSDICKIRPDHYKVNLVDGRFQVGGVVQDYEWTGDLLVLWFIAENDGELVAECLGQNESGGRITRFLVVDKHWVDRSMAIPHGAKLPRALDEKWYMPQGRQGDTVPFPYYSFPFFELSDPSHFSIYDSIIDSASDNPFSYFPFLQYFFCIN